MRFYRGTNEARQIMLKLRSIGLSDYSVLEGRQRIGRIRLATERIPGVWLWSVTVHLPGGGSSNAVDQAISCPCLPAQTAA